MRFIRIVSFLVVLQMLSFVIFGQQKDTVVQKTSLLKRTSFLPIPLLSFNRSYGITVGAILNAITVINPEDKISPPSKSSLGGGYTGNKSWFAFATQKLYLDEDKWRVHWALGVGNSNFQYFEETDDLGNGVFIDYQTRSRFFTTTVTYNVFSRVYTGIRYQYQRSKTEFDDPLIPDEDVNLSGVGIPVAFDSRDYVYYPAKGWFLNAAFFTNAEWLGSDITYSNFSLNANNFHRLGKKSILASRFYGYTGLGEVPFVGQKVVGGKDLRGYTQGEYRSDIVAALQTEMRYNFSDKWGAVFFGGIASAFKTDSYEGSGLLPGAGAGIRYMALRKLKMNVGVDVAAGKGDWGFYIRVGEAF